IETLAGDEACRGGKAVLVQQLGESPLELIASESGALFGGVGCGRGVHLSPLELVVPLRRPAPADLLCAGATVCPERMRTNFGRMSHRRPRCLSCFEPFSGRPGRGREPRAR